MGTQAKEVEETENSLSPGSFCEISSFGEKERNSQNRFSINVSNDLIFGFFPRRRGHSKNMTGI